MARSKEGCAAVPWVEQQSTTLVMARSKEGCAAVPWVEAA